MPLLTFVVSQSAASKWLSQVCRILRRCGQSSSVLAFLRTSSSSCWTPFTQPSTGTTSARSYRKSNRRSERDWRVSPGRSKSSCVQTPSSSRPRSLRNWDAACGVVHFVLYRARKLTHEPLCASSPRRTVKVIESVAGPRWLPQSIVATADTRLRWLGTWSESSADFTPKDPGAGEGYYPLSYELGGVVVDVLR